MQLEPASIYREPGSPEGPVSALDTCGGMAKPAPPPTAPTGQMHRGNRPDQSWISQLRFPLSLPSYVIFSKSPFEPQFWRL